MRHMIAEPESDKKLQRKDCFEKFCFAKYMTEKILKLFKNKYMNIKINTDCQKAEHIKIYIYCSFFFQLYCQLEPISVLHWILFSF